MVDRSNSERLRGFCEEQTDRQTDGWTDICYSSVALATENQYFQILNIEEILFWHLKPLLWVQNDARDVQFVEISCDINIMQIQNIFYLLIVFLANIYCKTKAKNEESDAYDSHLRSNTHDVLPIGATKINVYGHRTPENTNFCLPKKVWYSIVFSGVLWPYLMISVAPIDNTSLVCDPSWVLNSLEQAERLISHTRTKKVLHNFAWNLLLIRFCTCLPGIHCMYYCMYYYPNVYSLKLLKHRVFLFICYWVSTFILCYIYQIYSN